MQIERRSLINRAKARTNRGEIGSIAYRYGAFGLQNRANDCPVKGVAKGFDPMPDEISRHELKKI